ncbi:MAG: hypothetical protein GC179_16200 [Anaerolineaceae bacterium]|nr:hypothetical protein [Anaerolineaceae bacterium]
MDSLAEFSTLALYSEVSKNALLSKDHSWVSITKFYVTLIAAVIGTIAVWALIAHVGSTIYVPLSVDLASILTLTGIASTFVIILIIVSRAVEALEHEIRYLLAARHTKHDANNNHKLIHLHR